MLFNKKNLILLGLLTCSKLFASSFSITGGIFNKVGGAVPQVEITLKGPHLKDSLKTKSSSNGYWSLYGSLPTLKQNAQWRFVVNSNELFVQSSENLTAQVFNSVGEQKQELTSRSENGHQLFSLSALPMGMNFIRISSADKQMLFKCLKNSDNHAQISAYESKFQLMNNVYDTLIYTINGQLVQKKLIANLSTNTQEELYLDEKKILGNLDPYNIPKSSISVELLGSQFGGKSISNLTYGNNQQSYSGVIYSPYDPKKSDNNYSVLVIIQDSLGQSIASSPLVDVSSSMTQIQIDFLKNSTYPYLTASGPQEVSIKDNIDINVSASDPLNGSIVVQQIQINQGTWINFTGNQFSFFAPDLPSTIPWTVRVMDNDSNWVTQSGTIAVIQGVPTGSISGQTSISTYKSYSYSAQVNPIYGRIIKYEWDLGTGQFQVGDSTIEFSSITGGSQQILLRVTDDDNNQVTFFKDISISQTVYVEDLSLPHAYLNTTNGTGRWIPDADNGLSHPGTTTIVDENGDMSNYPFCNTVGVNCNPIQNGYLYGKIVINSYIPGTTTWGQWAGGGLILDPTIDNYVYPEPGSGIPPIGLNPNSVITIDMDVNITGGSSKTGNHQIKFRLGESQYFCIDDGTCMMRRLPAQSGRATYILNVKDFKKNNWIYTDADMKVKGRNVDKYNDVYRLEIRSDAEPQISATDACVPSTATFKIYKVTITNLTPP